MACTEPTTPGPTGTDKQWAAFFVAYAEYLVCRATNNGTDPISQYSTSFQTFLDAAEDYQGSLQT